MTSKVKAKLLVVVNSLLALAFLTQLVTVVLFFLGVYSSLLSMLHLYVGLGMFVLGIIHIILNFGWIKSKLLKQKS